MTAVLCVVAILTVRPRHPVKKKARLVPEVRTIKDPCFLLLVSGSFFVCLGMSAVSHKVPKTLFESTLGIFTPYFYVSTYAESLHISPNAAFCILAVMNGGGVFGRIAPAWLSDKIGRFNLLCPSAFFAGLTCLVFWMFGKDLVAIIIFAALYGLLSGAFTSVVTPCVAQISDIREIGTRIGVLYTFISVPCVSLRFPLPLWLAYLIRACFSLFFC